MRYKNLFLTLTGFLLIVLYALYKRAPTIHQSLVNDGYKLVSSSNKKEQIYTSILERNQKDINLIVLDPYLIGEQRKGEALSFWCDLETNRNSLFRDRTFFERFCVMAIADDVLDSKKYVRGDKASKLKEEGKLEKVEQHLNFIKKERQKDKKTSELSPELLGVQGCDSNSIKPIGKLNLSLAKDVYEYCYDDEN